MTVEDAQVLHPTSTAAEAVRLEVRTRFANKDRLKSYVLLVGSWSSDESDVEMRELPTWYVPVDELSGADGFAASDQPFGDLDDDGMWDIPIWRIIPRNSTENGVLINKVFEYFDLPPNTPWTEGVEIDCDNELYLNMPPPWLAEELSLALIASVDPSFAALVNLADELDWDTEHQILPTALANGRGVIVAGPSTKSNAPYWLRFSPEGFSFADAPPSAKPPLMVGCSCYLGAFDIYYEDSRTPLCRDWFEVNDWRKGPIGWIGPTRGSYQYVNYWLADALLELMTKYGHTFGQALLVASRRLMYLHPEAKALLQTYTGLGVPWLDLSHSPQYAGVVPSRGGSGAVRIYPNPLRRHETLHIALAGAPLAATITLKLFDAGGRLLRVSTPEELQDDRQVEFDMSDSQGRPLPAGVYFLRASHESRSHLRPIVLLR